MNIIENENESEDILAVDKIKGQHPKSLMGRKKLEEFDFVIFPQENFGINL